jgi:EmrB/QacA subfamily drug resistance transporter
MMEAPPAPSPRALVVATIMLGTVSTILAATIVNVAFPALIAELGVRHDTLQWVSAGFLAATASTMLATAWLVERFGERATFTGALSVFLAGSLLGAASTSAPMLIVARVLQGGAAGILQPLAMVTLFRVFPLEERGRAMGLYGFGVVLAPAVGPVLGGALVDLFGWRSIFLLTVPSTVAALVLGRRTLIGPAGGAVRRFDVAGAALLAASLVALLAVPVVAHRTAWASAATIATAASALLCAGGFLAWQRHTPQPLLSLHLFRTRSFAAASIVAFAYGVGLFGSTYLVPVFVQDLANFKASQAGLLLGIPGVALALAITAGGRLTDRVAPWIVVALGLGLFVVSSGLLAVSGPGTGFWLLALWLVIGRVGLGMLIPALNVGAVAGLSGTDLAYASSAINFVRQLGGAIGINLLAVMLEWRLTVYASEPARAFHECFAVVTLAFALALVPAFAIRPSGR